MLKYINYTKLLLQIKLKKNEKERSYVRNNFSRCTDLLCAACKYAIPYTFNS